MRKPDENGVGFLSYEAAGNGVSVLADSEREPNGEIFNGEGQDARRPRTPTEQKSTRPLSVDKQAQRAAGSPGALPSVFAVPETQAACQRIKAAASETYFPIVLSGTQLEATLTALSEAFDDAQAAMRQEPHGKDEIQPFMDTYSELMRLFMAVKAAKVYPNENWRGIEL